MNPGGSSGVPVKVDGTVYKDILVSSSGRSAWGSMSNTLGVLQITNSLDFRTGLGDNESSFSNSNESSFLKNGITFFSESSVNPHAVSCHNVEKYISEAYPSSIIETNHYMARCNNVSNSLAIGEGDFFNFVGTWSAIDETFNIVNNTIINNRPNVEGITYSSMLLAENITDVHNGTVNLKNNIAYRTLNRTSTRPFVRVVGTLPQETPVNVSYNACSYETEWTADGFVNTGDVNTNLSVDPKFKDDSRGLRTATTNHLGYTGSVTNNDLAIPYLLSNGFDDSGEYPTQNTDLATGYAERIDEVVDWIFEGYAPTNMTLATAGEGGTYVGAVMPQDAPTESANLTLSANKTEITLGETLTFTLSLSQALSTDTNIVLTVDGNDRDLLIPLGSLTDTTTHKPSSVGTKLISIKSTDNANVTITSPSSVSVVVKDDTPTTEGGYYWCEVGKPCVKIETIVFVK